MGERITGGTLAAVSFAGLWVYYTLTADAFHDLLGSFGVDTNLSASSDVLASLALSSASAIITVGGYETGKKCWGLLKSIGSNCWGFAKTIRNFCVPSGREQRGPLIPETEEENNLQPYVMGTLSTVLAGFTASTAYSIYHDWPINNEVAAMLVLTTAITSQFTLSAWAVDAALTKYSMSTNLREPILAKINTIIRKLPDISNEHLRAFKEILQSNFTAANA